MKMLAKLSTEETIKTVPVHTNSMEPFINRGDYISVKEINPYGVIQFGKIFWVELPEFDGLYRIRKSDDTNTIKLVPENMAFEVMEVNLAQIQRLNIVEYRLSKLI